MRTSGSTEAYARALFDLAVLSDAVDEVDEGIATVASAVRGNAELRETLADRAVPAEKKTEIMRGIFAGRAAPEAVAIATLMVDRGLVGQLGAVAETFRAISEKERGIVVADVTTAIALEDGVRTSVVEKLSASLGRPVTLREHVDGSILGGIVIRVAGRVLDGSLVAQLNAVRTVLVSAPAGGEA